MQLDKFSRMYKDLEKCSTESQLLLSDAYLATYNLDFNTPFRNIKSECLQQGFTFNLDYHLFTFNPATMSMEIVILEGCNLVLVDLLEDTLFSNGDASGENTNTLKRYGWTNLFNGSKSQINTSNNSNTYSMCTNGSYNYLMKNKQYTYGIPEIMGALDQNSKYNYNNSITPATNIEDAKWSVWYDPNNDLSGISAQLSIVNCVLSNGNNYGLINDITKIHKYCSNQPAPDALQSLNPPCKDISISDLTYAGYEWNNGNTLTMYKQAPRNGGDEYSYSTIFEPNGWGGGSYFNSCSTNKLCDYPSNLNPFNKADLSSIVLNYVDTLNGTGSGYVLNPLDENNGKPRPNGENIIPIIFGHGIAPFQYPGSTYLFRIKRTNSNKYIYICVMMLDQPTASLEIGTDDIKTLRKFGPADAISPQGTNELDFTEYQAGDGFHSLLEFRLVDNNPYSVPKEIIKKYNLTRRGDLLSPTATLKDWYIIVDKVL